ncbi:hypothetical protein L6164_005029 [Bauhinia variegata]|uniref:Uncharacterized protein n=1 Tax=Bauhinia variegata TaxID=167791 RepID=A0ACB9PS63_BAUVA|nr:hypothetical protein L6164_005029 [Bauhinia variegata]
MAIKLLAVAWFLVSMISCDYRINVQASARLPIGIEPPRYVTVTGCNNDCDTACCNCDIRRQPPLCVLCCQEDP